MKMIIRLTKWLLSIFALLVAVFSVATAAQNRRIREQYSETLRERDRAVAATDQ